MISSELLARLLISLYFLCPPTSHMHMHAEDILLTLKSLILGSGAKPGPLHPVSATPTPQTGKGCVYI